MSPTIVIFIVYAVIFVIRNFVRNQSAKKGGSDKPFDRVRGKPQGQNADQQAGGVGQQGYGSGGQAGSHGPWAGGAGQQAGGLGAGQALGPGQQAGGGGQQGYGSGGQHPGGFGSSLFGSGPHGSSAHGSSPVQQAAQPFGRQASQRTTQQTRAMGAASGQAGAHKQLLGTIQRSLLRGVGNAQPPSAQQRLQPNVPAPTQPRVAMAPQVTATMQASASRLHEPVSSQGGSLTTMGRQAPRLEGPTHDETIDHIYKLDDCESPALEFLRQEKKGELSLAEGMIWAQILGEPRGRQLMLRRARKGKPPTASVATKAS